MPSKIESCPSSLPGSRSSEPVDRITTRGRGRERTDARPTDGEQAEPARAEDRTVLDEQVALGDVVAGRPDVLVQLRAPGSIRTESAPRSVHS